MTMNSVPRFPRELGELREEILDVYRKDGQSVVTEMLFQEWVVKRQEEAYKEGTMGGMVKAGIEVLDLLSNLDGDTEKIMSEYESWKDLAYQEGLDNLVGEIEAKIAEIH